MSVNSQLAFWAFLPILATFTFVVLEKYTSYKKCNYYVRQVLVGITFGIIAVLGTEFGVNWNGIVLNVRDAATFSSGLFFGGPAGLIAGTIGGAERYFSVLWGVGTYSQIACSVSTFIAGVLGAVLRKFMFDNKKPSFLLSAAIGAVFEVFHMTLVLLTNLNDINTAMSVIIKCSPLMITYNAISLGLASLVAAIIHGEFKIRRKKARISQTIQEWLLVSIVIVSALIMLFFNDLENEVCKNTARDILKQTNEDIKFDIKSIVNDYYSSNNKSNNKRQLEDLMSLEAQNRHVGDNGFVLVADYYGKIVSGPSNNTKNELSDYGLNKYSIMGKMSETRIDNIDYCYIYDSIYDYYIVVLIPKDEVFATKDTVLYAMGFCVTLAFALLFGMIYMLIKNVVVKQIDKINISLAKITGGDLNEVVNVRNNSEFASLSDDINRTVDALKEYIKEAAARIDKELEYAKTIQYSSVPNVFPKNESYDIYASMHTAKEVGGDFYDFYQQGTDKLNFLVADVSGKGIPASLFMMRAKSGLHALTESGIDVEQVFIRGNNSLCDGNDGGMFVTAWQGCLNLKDGVIEYANAGHNPPLVKHKNGEFEYIKGSSGLVLGGMEDIPYKRQVIKLMPGDIIFVYTDGVTEATNIKNELYSEERLKTKLNSIEYNDMKELCEIILQDVNDFAGTEVDQFDDITMLAVKYIGPPKGEN